METEVFVKLLNVIAIATVMLSIGLKVKFAEVIAAARQIRLVALSLVANFVLVPLATVGLLYCFQAPTYVSAGFLILAACPGAPVGPTFTAIAKGDVALATGLMVILAASSALLAPALLTVLLAWLIPAGDLHFDYLDIARILVVTQLFPLGIGLCIHEWAPKLADRLVKPTTLLANVLLLGVVCLILATQYETLQAVRLRGWFGMTILLVISLGVGWFCGGRDRTARSALAVATGARNAAVGLVIVSANFAETSAVTAVVADAMLAIFGTLLFSFLLGKFALPERARGLT